MKTEKFKSYLIRMKSSTRRLYPKFTRRNILRKIKKSVRKPKELTKILQDKNMVLVKIRPTPKVPKEILQKVN